ncbi:MAG: phosphoribosyltransferase [Silvanigrellaceae bacterium]
MNFENRQSAAKLLLEKLFKFKTPETVVLAIPRGAVPMGVILSQGLNCPMSLVPVRKIASPLAPEFALGAADVEGNFYPEDEDVLQVPKQQMRLWLKKSLEVLRVREFRWRKYLPRISLANKTVIVVDDGVATGATMRAALMWVRRKQPARIIAAVPVASREGVEMMRRFAEHLECLYVPDHFAAVGDFYSDFAEVGDEDVCQLLKSLTQARDATETVANIDQK